MERRLGFVGEPYRAGTPQRLATAAKALTAAGSVLMARAGGRRSGAAAAGLALMAGAAAERWAIFQAGMASAKDPRYTVGPQRDRLEQRA
jgi:hypothetical protein